MVPHPLPSTSGASSLPSAITDPDNGPEVLIADCPGGCPGPFKIHGKVIPVNDYIGSASTEKEYFRKMLSRIGHPQKNIRFVKAPAYYHKKGVDVPWRKCPRVMGTVINRRTYRERFIVVYKHR